MRTTIDRAGRLVIPKALRERIGMDAGEVDVEVEGAGLRIAPVAATSLVRRGSRLVVPPGGAPLDDAAVQALRDDQR